MKNSINTFIIIACLCSSILSAQEEIEYSKLVGESKGTFYDIPELKGSQSILDYSIRSISVDYDKFVRMISVTYFTGKKYTNVDKFVTEGYTLGGREVCPDCERFICRFDPGEYIIRVEGRSGALIDRITFFTNKGKQFGPFGGSGGQPFSISPPLNNRIVGFYGSSNPAVHQIGIKYVNENAFKNIWEKYGYTVKPQILNTGKVKGETNKKKFIPSRKGKFWKARITKNAVNKTIH